MDFLSAFSDWEYNAVNGTLSPHQRGLMNDALAADIRRAGGDDQAVAAAIEEQNSYLDSQWSERTPLQTLRDVVSGDPLGLKQGTTNWVLWGVGAIVVILVLGMLFRGRR